ncbi:MAG: molybdopterin-dependent oxidoreductase [Flavobacteriales bacterium]|nr:molybdopterin-dependent oxidoreductase [Flavobacteriales bacterium]
MSTIINQEAKTTCSYCGVGCGIVVSKDSRGKVSVAGDENHPVNKGMLCSKGMNLHYVANDLSDRLLYPQMRWSKSHSLERVSWEVALERVASVFKTLIKKHGSDSVAFYVSGQCLTEEYYIINKLVKGFIGTNNIDTNSRLCMSSAVVGYKKTVGEDSVPICYDDIELADCFLVTGANPAWCHPILWRRIQNHKEKNPNTKIIVVDPRKTDSASYADIHIQLNPGTDVVLNNAIARQLIENDLIDLDFIKNHTENYESLKELVFQTSLEKSAEICGVDSDLIQKTAQIIGKSKGFISMWTMGLNQSVNGVDKNTSLLNISLITGKIGKPGSGPFSLTGQPNAMGGREVGGMANLLAVHKNLENPIHRKEVADFWKVDEISSKPGYTATQIFDEIDNGNLKAIWIVCTNPMVSMPNVRKVEKALKKAKFVVVQDISNKSNTLEYADLVLPAAGWLEKEGTMTNSERRISYLPKVLDPPQEAKPDVQIIWEFAQKMGYHGFDYKSAEEVYNEYIQMTKGTNIDITALSYSRLKKEGTFQYPVNKENPNGTSRLFENHQFYTPSKKAIINIPSHILREDFYEKSKDFPLILTTGRIRDQWHTMTKTGKVSRLNTHIPKPILDINPEDALALNLSDEMLVEVKSAFGEVRVKVKITDTIKKGTVFLPMHWGKQLQNDLNRCNNLTSNLIDPISKEPDFKFTRVSIEKYIKKPSDIVIIGAGAASFRFVQNFREHNKEDKITVFSDEPNPFYNRVLLPEYAVNHLSWEELQKIKQQELDKLNINLKIKNTVKQIDKENKWIVDTENKKIPYDKLIIATGSRPFVPKDMKLDIPGVYTIRKKSDVDDFKMYLEQFKIPQNQKQVIIVGGGLLGLELAVSLRKIDIQVIIIQRGSRLMERQLDEIASRILKEEIQDEGIEIYFDNEVSTVFNSEETNILSINLKNGKNIHAHAMVYSIGTVPNIELAKNAQLECGRGVKINQYLQTSDENIFAIGEIAEFENQVFGITSAAEQQADILSNFLSGDISSYYSGSVLMNIIKLENLDLCSIGIIEYPENDDSYQEIVLCDLALRFYKKCIIKDDLLVGAILIGDKNEFAEFKMLIENKVELSNKRTELLRGSSNSKPMKGKLICSCSQVGDGNLIETIKSGVSSFTDLCNQTGAGLGCGSCKSQVKEILDSHLVSENA